MPKTIEKKSNKIHALGRRKNARCTINMLKGEGENSVNGKKVEEYFTEMKQKSIIFEPLVLTNTLNDFHFSAKVSGGGLMGQAGALKLAIARSLAKQNEQYHTVLSSKKMLMRDPRAKERKKVFFVRARKKPQFSKR